MLDEDIHLQNDLWQAINDAYELLFPLWFSSCYRVVGGVCVGNNCFFNNYCTLASRAGITIGEGTIFGENVKVYDHNHCYKDVNEPIKYQGYTEAPIVIGKHCWIASNVVILKGVKIGDNCVIGAGCVVYKDVPEGTVMIKK